MNYDDVKDSGEREEFDTGSRRDTRKGKGRYDLISPIAMARLARHMEAGAAKYGDRNWELGQPTSRFMDSALRHLFAYLGGARDEDHLSAVLFNVMAIIHTEETLPTLNTLEVVSRPYASPPTESYNIVALGALADLGKQLDEVAEMQARQAADLAAVSVRVAAVDPESTPTGTHRADIPWVVDPSA